MSERLTVDEREAACICVEITDVTGLKLNDARTIAICDLHVSTIVALAARLAEVEALLGRVLDDKRIRHDHAYPMEVGPHHCAGCDLQDQIRAALAADRDTTEPAVAGETRTEG